MQHKIEDVDPSHACTACLQAVICTQISIQDMDDHSKGTLDVIVLIEYTLGCFAAFPGASKKDLEASLAAEREADASAHGTKRLQMV